VQKAVQSSLAGSVVVNTLLQRPGQRDLAMRFYPESLAEASKRHRDWARSHYARAASTRAARFWRERAEAAPPPDTVSPELGGDALSEVPLRLSPQVQVVEVPCVVDRFIELRLAVRSTTLDAPVAYLGGMELVPLLRRVRNGMTPRAIVRSWMPGVPPETGLAIAQWMVSRQLLVPCPDTPVALGKG
jgi:hypothetical protein